MKKVYIFLVTLILLLCSGCKKVTYLERTIYAFDTVVTLKIECDENLMQEFENKIIEYSILLDDYKEYDIENICTLNKNRSIEYNVKLWEVLGYCTSINEESFNIFIGKVNRLWKEVITSQSLADESQIEFLLNEAKQTSVQVIDGNIVLIGNGDIDLGGIAKGYVLDLIVTRLKELEITHYAISFGSSSIAVGEKEDGTSYKILIKGTNKVIELKHKCLSVSAIDEQFCVIDGNVYHHIIDCESGYPKNYITKLVIIGDDAKKLDYLTTALFSKEVEELKEYDITMYAFNGEEQVVGD